MFFYKNALSLRNDSYAKPSAKKFLKQQFFRYCFITGARSRTPGVFHVNVFSSSYIVILYCICFIRPAVGKAFTFHQPDRQWLRLYWQRYHRQSPSH